MIVHLTISDPVLDRLPELAVYAVRASNMRSSLFSADTIAILTKAVSECIVQSEDITTNDVIAAWREAYGTMGVKPSKFRSSIESLIRRAAKRSDLSLPVPAVNIYNACSINCMSPIGAYDVARMPGAELVLREAQSSADRFIPLGAAPTDFPLNDRLIVYAVADEILCWGLNCRDSTVAALTESTDEAIFFSEAVRPQHRENAARALRSLASLMTSFGARPSEVVCADRTSRSLAF